MDEGEEIRFIDLFSGIGGFRLGLERAGGFRCVWSCDNNKYANQIYFRRFKPKQREHHTGDIRRFAAKNIPDHDLLCAGFPCQAFSVAGKRKGFGDTRGTLFHEIVRIARVKRPTLLLLENVKGLLSHDKGQTFGTILEVLGSIGYRLEWQVLNSKWFSVPQNRERVFIIGHLGEGCSRPIFPIREIHKDGIERNHIEKRWQIGATLSGRSVGGGNARGNYVLTPREEATAIDSNYWTGPDQHDQRTIVIDFFNKSLRRDNTFNTLKTSQGSAASSSVIAIGSSKPTEEDVRGRSPVQAEVSTVAISFTNPHDSEEERRANLSDISRAVKPPYGNQQPLILHNIYGGFKEDIRVFNEYSPTIRTAKGGGHLPSVLQDFRIRRLTPVECERLQGFPDFWTRGISDTNRYKCLGNAVTVDVIEYLGRQIKKAYPLHMRTR